MNSDPFDLGQDFDAASMPTTQRARAAMHPAPDTFLEALNPEQCEAVIAPDGPLLVLAGAGTGKTRVLTTRIAYKIASGQAYPDRVLAVTFTNKAAREMKTRIGTLVGRGSEAMPWLGTFHSISAKLLRRHAELVGLRNDFTILDTDDQIRLLKQLIQAENIDEKRWPGRLMAGYIDRWKNRGWSPEHVPNDEADAFGEGRGGKIYEQYQARLKTLNAADFGDLLLESLRLLRENHDILQRYQNRFAHILVDEYQDANAVQYLWLRALAQAHNNICCVGDDDQSIYGWRGAEVDNILRFEKDFAGAQIIRLEQNYRSTSHILGAASGLIAANQSRLGKTLWTQENGGEPVLIRGAWDSEQEARLTAEDIETHHRKQHKLNEIAILVRASFQMREFEDRFITLGIPYRVIGGPRFYERAEIRDANAYLRLVAQSDDDLAFERICNRPRRGLGAVALQTLHHMARRNNVSLYRAAHMIIETDELKPAARRALAAFINDVERWRGLIDATTHYELAERILDESGYTAMWQADKSADAPGKLENLKELIRSMQEFETLAAYLEHISLVMEAETDDTSDRVSLMTLHSAKGLEFDTVFLPGWEEGLLPSQRTLDESGNRGLEEERRLAHVGLTRARKNATISFVGSRRTHGQWQTATPSRFIDEIPKEFVQTAETESVPQSRFAQDFATANANYQTPNYKTPGWRRAQENMNNPQTPIHAKAMQASSFDVGARIFHQKFGYGRVETIDGDKLTIAFDKAGRKKVLESFVESAPPKR